MGTRPIVNVADAPVQEFGQEPHFGCSMAQLGQPSGAQAIGANVTTLAPGKAAFPLHHHYANEEHFFILSGSGTLRLGAETHPVRRHDYVSIPAGGPETAHQLVHSCTAH